MSTTPQSAPRVMIVDDQSYFRTPMVRLLGDQGFRVIACMTETHAIEQAESSDWVAIAFVDLNLADSGGIETAARLHRTAPWMTIYLTTPTDRATTPEDWTGEGVAGILQKPIPAKRLAELCAAAIARCARKSEGHSAIVA